jgi:hypothetical protein
MPWRSRETYRLRCSILQLIENDIAAWNADAQVGFYGQP